MLQESSRPVTAHKLEMQNRNHEDLHVKRLTLEKGEVELEGKICEIVYHESRKEKTAGGVLSRLFG